MRYFSRHHWAYAGGGIQLLWIEQHSSYFQRFIDLWWCLPGSSIHRCAVSHANAVSRIDVPFHTPMCGSKCRYTVPHIGVRFQVSVCRSTYRCAVSCVTYRCASPYVDMSIRHFTYRCDVPHIDVPFYISTCCSTYRYTTFHVSIYLYRSTYRCAAPSIEVLFHISMRRFTYRCVVSRIYVPKSHIDVPFQISIYRSTYHMVSMWRSRFWRVNTGSRARSDQSPRIARQHHLYIISKPGQALLCTHPSRERAQRAHRHKQERPKKYQNPADHFIAPQKRLWECEC